MHAETNLDRDQILLAAERCRGALLAYAFALLGDWALAEDVLQEACLVVMDKWTEVSGRAEVFPWFRQIVRLKTFEALRRQHRERPYPGERLSNLLSRAVEENLDARWAEEHEREREALRHCMQQLDRSSVALLSGFYARGEPCETLASGRGKSVNAIRLAISRLRARLRQCVRMHMPMTNDE